MSSSSSPRSAAASPGLTGNGQGGAADHAKSDGPPHVADHKSARQFIHEVMSGEVVRTPHGEHFETERLWERHRRHSSVDICRPGRIAEQSLLDAAFRRRRFRATPPARWAFLDTETTGPRRRYRHVCLL